MTAEIDPDPLSIPQVRSRSSDVKHMTDASENLGDHDEWFLAELAESQDEIQEASHKNTDSIHPELYLIIFLWIMSIVGGAAAFYHIRS